MLHDIHECQTKMEINRVCYPTMQDSELVDHVYLSLLQGVSNLRDQLELEKKELGQLPGV